MDKMNDKDLAISYYKRKTEKLEQLLNYIQVENDKRLKTFEHHYRSEMGALIFTSNSHSIRLRKLENKNDFDNWICRLFK